MINTRFEYLYRDAGNFKRFGSVLLSGELSTFEHELIVSKLDGKELFVAEQVGLPSLRAEWIAEGVAPSISDHNWHELLSIAPTSCGGPTLMPATKLADRFKAVDHWDLSLVKDIC